MSKSSNKQRLKQLKIWLSQEIHFGKGKNNPKSENYVSHKNDKQPLRKGNYGKNDQNPIRESYAKRIQKFIDENEKRSRYCRKSKSYSYSESVFTNNP